MSVQGGRSWWRRALASGGWAGALGLLVAAGCGGRTSALDGDVYDPNAQGMGDGDEAGSSAGGSSAGRGSVAGGPNAGGRSPTAGSGSTPGGPSGVNPNLASAPCNAYCPGYGTQCKGRLMGQECFAACQAELNSFGPRCQALGIEALKCLTPYFTPGAPNCDAAVNVALSNCGFIVNEFQNCKGLQTSPGPSMPAMPTPGVDVTNCAVNRYADPLLCFDQYACGPEMYMVLCTFSSTTADCSCSGPKGTISGQTVPNDGNACYTAAVVLCR